ncbi:hypothetical protein [Planktotalea sp.]|uniref:hypothetical protein n=1 Tax=Planktotalea sp. TaxID=2029877 RepID=UPI003297EDE5
MSIHKIIGAFVLSSVATGAFAQDCTNPANAGTTACTGFANATFSSQNVAVAAPAADIPAAGAVFAPASTTGFVPLAGAALGAAGPLAIGLGAIIAIGAVSGGSNSTTSTE